MKKEVPKYDHKAIEPKWQKRWEEEKLYEAKEDAAKKKFYGLIEFPYPSGEGLHVGHIRSNTAMDIISRKRRMEGYNVLYPIGWDAFGLPTENYAIKSGIHPAVVTKTNTDNFRRQLKMLGFGFDWSREINTTDPEYYRWTQWIFLQLFKKGLAYKKRMAINWCPKDLIGLANEEVVNGHCERCGTAVEKREKEQWMLAITKYADRLDKDLDQVDYLERIKIQQKNWIGKSEGARIDFRLTADKLEEQGSNSVSIFTTRPDTLYGVTYLVMAPEHPSVQKFLPHLENRKEVEEYIARIKKATDIERTDVTREKTGVEFKGVKAINPLNNEEVPVWIADYVLPDYGTGAVMAVPAHDERDYEFAQKYNLPVRHVVIPHILEADGAFTGEGVLYDSGKFTGRNSSEILKEITRTAGGEWLTTYKLRDWVFSRQRYWGEPIPLIICKKCGVVPVPENELPVKLPDVDNYKPTETGESPLAAISEWVNVKCPNCGGDAKRETDTMPQWAGSSWYYLRYADPRNSNEFASQQSLKQWTPVDWYNGGMEHTTLHLLYSRFWHKFLFDLGLVPTTEPYMKRTSHGLILAEGGEKMSKSKGNVVNPDTIIEAVGADSLRLYEMFMGPFDQPIAWGTDNIAGVRRFIEKVWRLQEKIGEKNLTVEGLLHRTIKKVSEDIEAMRFNTAISALMIAVNEVERAASLGKEQYEILVRLLAPFVPHVAEELWALLGNENMIHLAEWPIADSFLIVESEATIMVQINGKVRGSFVAERGLNDKLLEEMAAALPEVKRWLEGKNLVKTIVIKDKLVNLVVKD